MRSPSIVAQQFVARVNAHDIDGILALLEQDDARTEAARRGWEACFASLPDYRIEIDELAVDGAVITVFGWVCGSLVGPSKRPGRVPATWKAWVQDERVLDWSLCSDYPLISSPLVGEGKDGGTSRLL